MRTRSLDVTRKQQRIGMYPGTRPRVVLQPQVIGFLYRAIVVYNLAVSNWKVLSAYCYFSEAEA